MCPFPGLNNYRIYSNQLHQAMRISIFRTPRARQFTYRPLYYDERKEELEQIKEQYSDPEKARQLDRIRERIGRRWNMHRNHKRSSEKQGSGMVLFFYLLIVAALIYIVFFLKVF